jgi:WD40 repeat protein
VGSFAVVAFADTSRLEIGGDTLIRLATESPAGSRPAARKVYLESGSVAADFALPLSEPPMVVATKHAEASFQQTKSSFAIAADETRIEQVQGNLKVTRKSDGRSIDVPTGWYAVTNEKNAFKAERLPEQVTQARLTMKDAGAVLQACYSPDGTLLATGCNDGTIKLYDAATGELKKTLVGHKRPVKALAFAPVGCLLASGNDEKIVKLWDPIRGIELATLKGNKGVIEALAFSPDAVLLATAGGYGKNTPEIRLWDVVSRQELGVFPGEHSNRATAVAFSADGKWLATGGMDNAVKVWDVYSRLVRQTLAGHTGRINAVAFSADGKRLASASKDRTVKLWDFAAGTEERTLPSHAGEVRAVAFAPDGKRLASADNSVTLWDAATGREGMILKGHKNAIAALAFAPGGRELASAGYDRTVRVWEIAAKN